MVVVFEDDDPDTENMAEGYTKVLSAAVVYMSNYYSEIFAGLDSMLAACAKVDIDT